jgi:hypothetical protein
VSNKKKFKKRFDWQKIIDHNASAMRNVWKMCFYEMRRLLLGATSMALAAGICSVFGEPPGINGVNFRGEDVSTALYFSRDGYGKKTNFSAMLCLSAGSHDWMDSHDEYVAIKNFIIDRSAHGQVSLSMEMAQPMPGWRLGPFVSAHYTFARQDIRLPYVSFEEYEKDGLTKQTYHQFTCLKHNIADGLIALKLERDGSAAEECPKQTWKSPRDKSASNRQNCSCTFAKSLRVQTYVGLQRRLNDRFSSPWDSPHMQLGQDDELDVEAQKKYYENVESLMGDAYGPDTLIVVCGNFTESLRHGWILQGQTSSKFGKKYESYAVSVTFGKEF